MQISEEVGHCLYLAQPAKVKETLVLDATILDLYLRLLEDNVAQSYTLYSKLSRLRLAIDFVALNLVFEVLHQVKGIIKNWMSVFRRDSQKING